MKYNWIRNDHLPLPDDYYVCLFIVHLHALLESLFALAVLTNCDAVIYCDYLLLQDVIDWVVGRLV